MAPSLRSVAGFCMGEYGKFELDRNSFITTRNIQIFVTLKNRLFVVKIIKIYNFFQITIIYAICAIIINYMKFNILTYLVGGRVGVKSTY